MFLANLNPRAYMKTATLGLMLDWSILLCCSWDQWEKTFVIFSGFWLLKGWWWGWLSESVKKGKLATKILFSDNVEWSSKNLWKIIFADVIANKTE